MESDQTPTTATLVFDTVQPANADSHPHDPDPKRSNRRHATDDELEDFNNICTEVV